MGNPRGNLKVRTRRFAADVIAIVSSFPETRAANIVAHQIMRSASSVGANYRASQRPRSTADMIAKLKLVEEELDETLYWLELLVETNVASKTQLKPLYLEGNELLSIVVASIKTLRATNGKVSENGVAYGLERDSVFD